MTRNMSGKTKVKKADAGLRQNDLFVQYDLAQSETEAAHAALSWAAEPAGTPLSARPAR